MDYSAESIRFLHAAYILMALGQLGYVAFLMERWRRVNAEKDRTQSSDA